MTDDAATRAIPQAAIHRGAPVACPYGSATPRASAATARTERHQA
jgi:hypothetical protein